MENSQNVILKYASKRHSYGPLTYNARNELAAIDHNAHCEREVVVNKNGSKRWEWRPCILLNTLKIIILNIHGNYWISCWWNFTFTNRVLYYILDFKGTTAKREKDGLWMRLRHKKVSLYFGFTETNSNEKAFWWYWHEQECDLRSIWSYETISNH